MRWHFAYKANDGLLYFLCVEVHVVWLHHVVLSISVQIVVGNEADQSGAFCKLDEFNKLLISWYFHWSYKECCENQKTSSAWHLFGWKCLVDERGQR